MKKLKFINNYKYRGHWGRMFHFNYTKDWSGKHFLVGIFNLFVFIVI